MPFAFRDSFVPAARADAISVSRSAESKTPSQWYDGSMEAGLRRRLPLLARIATCRFDAVAHDSVTLSRKPMSVSEPS